MSPAKVDPVRHPGHIVKLRTQAHRLVQATPPEPERAEDRIRRIVLVEDEALIAWAIRRSQAWPRGRARPQPPPITAPMMLTPRASTMVLKAKATRACTVTSRRNRLVVMQKSETWQVAPTQAAI